MATIRKELTEAEVRAGEVVSLEAFSAVSIPGIRRTLSEALRLIGRGLMFGQFTNHDISHVDGALENLDWIVTDAARKVMTPVDWLLIVLAVYFHDFGMLVTEDEFGRRDGSSGFATFREKVMRNEWGVPYKERVLALGAEEAERFLYQDFVRENHAVRVADWINGVSDPRLGAADGARDLVNEMLATLPERFRRDLALVCESHHLNDLDDFKKYPISRPYAPPSAAAANVHYAALVLRTTDLFHITSDRTPSVAFRLIAPTDPISQVEWSKQMGVSAVRPRLGKDAEGNPSPSAPRDTIEVHALFKDDTAFFALTQYLSYAEEQLRFAAEWARSATKMASQHHFPWRFVDQSQVEAEGFIRETLNFNLDSRKILDLLVGHTLYNDSRVAIREIVQNSLDAVRLRCADEGVAPSTAGKIYVRWDPDSSVLTVQDNGTGMTQETIERHLLTVGSSFYQEEEFKTHHPTFSPISRFGIGILSCFLISDDVEILTSHPDEAHARRLSLRSVHGRYLVRLLEKSDDSVLPISAHGTIVRLKIRPGVDRFDPVAILKHWFLFPQSVIEASVGSDAPVSIGYDSPRALMTEAAHELYPGIEIERIEIHQHEDEGLIFAHPILHGPNPRRPWRFLTEDGLRRRADQFSGVAIEGVRVLAQSPVLPYAALVGVANLYGPNAPRTTVSRSGIDGLDSLQQVQSRLLRLLCSDVAQEARAMAVSSSSTSAAAVAAQMMIRPLGSARFMPAGTEELLTAALSDIPMFPIEEEAGRRLVSASDLATLPTVWTVDGTLAVTAERFLRETSGDPTLRELLGRTEATPYEVPLPLLCGVPAIDPIWSLAFKGRGVDAIFLDPARRLLNLGWSVAAADEWIRVDADVPGRSAESRALFVSTGHFDRSPLGDASGFFAHDSLFLCGEDAIQHYVLDLVASEREGTAPPEWLTGVARAIVNYWRPSGATTLASLEHWLVSEARLDSDTVSGRVVALFEALQATTGTVFHPNEIRPVS